MFFFGLILIVTVVTVATVVTIVVISRIRLVCVGFVKYIGARPSCFGLGIAFCLLFLLVFLFCDFVHAMLLPNLINLLSCLFVSCITRAVHFL